MCGLVDGSGMCRGGMGSIGDAPIIDGYTMPEGSVCPSGYFEIGGGGGNQCCATWEGCNIPGNCCLTDADCASGNVCKSSMHCR
jgi:hypothetical protein